MPAHPKPQTAEQRTALASIEALVSRRENIERTIDAIARQAAVDGCTYSALGAALGISKQAAQKRFGRP